MELRRKHLGCERRGAELSIIIIIIITGMHRVRVKTLARRRGQAGRLRRTRRGEGASEGLMARERESNVHGALRVRQHSTWTWTCTWTCTVCVCTRADDGMKSARVNTVTIVPVRLTA